MTGGSRCLARHVDCRTTNESMSKVIGPSEQLQHGANQLLLGDRLVRVHGTAQGLIPFPNAVPERLECVGGRDRLPPFGRGAYPLGQKVLGKQMARHVFASPGLRDSPSPASPSRRIVPCIEAERLGDIPQHPCAPQSRPRRERDADRGHHVFDQNEHPCQNEYIPSIRPTGISRSQLRANSRKCQVNRGGTPLLQGLAACRKSVDPPALSSEVQVPKWQPTLDNNKENAPKCPAMSHFFENSRPAVTLSGPAPTAS